MSERVTHAMVLAAGFGKRLRPITDRIPKPLVEVGGRAMLDRAIDKLENYGVSQVVVNTAYKPEMIEAHVAKRISPSIYISHEQEDQPLETGGGIAKALPHLGNQPFFSMNSDTICIDGAQSPLQRLQEAWSDDLDVVMLLHPRERAIGYAGAGDFALREDGAMRRRGSDDEAPYVFTGVQLVHPRLFDNSPEGSFSLNVLYDRLLDDDGYFTRTAAVIHDGEWLHVGDMDGLNQAEHYFKKAA